MTVKLKILIIFLGVYLFSNVITTVFLVLAIRTVLVGHAIDYIDGYVSPILDVYRKHYKDPKIYIRGLAEALASERLSVIVLNKKNKILYIYSFSNYDEERLPLLDVENVIKEKHGVINDYIFITKTVGNYKLIFLNKIDEIKQIQKKLIFFTLALSSVVSILTSLIIVFLVRSAFKPLTYLTDKLREVYKGNMDVNIKKQNAKDEFSILINTFADMLEKLKETFNFQKETIANFAHALKTPLTYIKGQLELLSYGVYETDKEKFKEVIKSMQIQAEKMHRLINKLLLLMRLESGIPIKKEELSLSEVFAEVEEEYEYIRNTHNFIVEYPKEDLIVLADREYLKIAISNLVENSYKYTPEGGTIKLYIKEYCVVVEDTGKGIKDTQRVFERFYREDGEKEGFGLGLSIVKAIADLHGFRIHVESQPGAGSKFYLCFS
ncbi:sensor histidine kinase [Thermocrinis minervae]|uniref:histidine kinase n=1 Tax=Thermocrinis minervae TaxID=381751 RepID=A0A1M6RAD6_9AQUI|nr:HAMP domain-containing sensor histidine kinase [Thermocrinis minervae]SHK29298.1 Signal transduction histidine kinase [Thermocrinis minervae]